MAGNRPFQAVRRVAAFVLLGFGGAGVLKDYVVDVCPISGNSMSPTLSASANETGARDWIAWKMWRPSHDLKIGDIVLFTCPLRPEATVVKRIIALGGDTVMLDPRRRPGYGHDQIKPEMLADALRWDTYPDHKLIVPYGHVWVEGDNWRASRDSNYYGPVSKGLILGRAWTALFPANISFTKPWEGYQSSTKVIKGREDLPEVWLD